MLNISECSSSELNSWNMSCAKQLLWRFCKIFWSWDSKPQAEHHLDQLCHPRPLLLLFLHLECPTSIEPMPGFVSGIIIARMLRCLENADLEGSKERQWKAIHSMNGMPGNDWGEKFSQLQDVQTLEELSRTPFCTMHLPLARLLMVLIFDAKHQTQTIPNHEIDKATNSLTSTDIHWYFERFYSFSSCFMLTLSHIVLAKTGKVHQSLTRSSTAFKMQLKLERRKSVIFDVYKVKGQRALQRGHSVPPTKPSFCPWKGVGSRSPLNFGNCSLVASTKFLVVVAYCVGKIYQRKWYHFPRWATPKTAKWQQWQMFAAPSSVRNCPENDFTSRLVAAISSEHNCMGS